MDQIKITGILKEFIGKRIDVNKLDEIGFASDVLVKSVNISDESNLLNNIQYIDKYFFEDITLSKTNEGEYTVASNNFDQNDVEYLNSIADLERRIESLTNAIFAYRFEFNDNEMAAKLEKERELFEAKVKANKIGRDLRKYE